MVPWHLPVTTLKTAEESKQPKVSFVACDIVRKHGPHYLSTYQ